MCERERMRDRKRERISSNGHSPFSKRLYFGDFFHRDGSKQGNSPAGKYHKQMTYLACLTGLESIFRTYEARLFARNLIKTLFQLLNLLSKLFNYDAK